MRTYILSLGAFLIATFAPFNAEATRSSVSQDFLKLLREARHEENSKIQERRRDLVREGARLRDERSAGGSELSASQKELKDLRLRADLLSLVGDTTLARLADGLGDKLYESIGLRLSEVDNQNLLDEGKVLAFRVDDALPETSPFNIEIRVQAKEVDGEDDSIKLSFETRLVIKEEWLDEEKKKGSSSFARLLSENGAEDLNKALDSINEAVLASHTRVESTHTAQAADESDEDYNDRWASFLESQVKQSREQLSSNDVKTRYTAHKSSQESAVRVARELASLDRESESESSVDARLRRLAQQQKVLEHLAENSVDASASEEELCKLLVEIFEGWDNLGANEKRNCAKHRESRTASAERRAAAKAGSESTPSRSPAERAQAAEEGNPGSELAEHSRATAAAANAQARFADLMQHCMNVYQQAAARAPFDKLFAAIEPVTEALYTRVASCAPMGEILPAIDGVGDPEIEGRRAVRSFEPNLAMISTGAEAKVKDREIQDEIECLQRVSSYAAMGMERLMTGLAMQGVPEQQARQDAVYLQLQRFSVAARAGVAAFNDQRATLAAHVEALRGYTRGALGAVGSPSGAARPMAPAVGAAPAANVGGATRGTVGPPAARDNRRPADAARQAR